MKRLKKTMYVMLILFIVSACEEPEQEIFSSIRQGTDAPNSELLADVLKQGAYASLIGTWGGHNSLWSLHEVSSDEMVIAQKGADWEDGGQWIRVHQHDYRPLEQSINNGWSYLFGALAQINTLILAYPEVEILQAEMKLLRAMVYFWIMDAYGQAPIIEETATDPTPPSNSRQEIYDFIEASILENAEALSRQDNKTIMNFYTAHTLLAKLYLNAEVYTGEANYAGVIEACDVVINSGLYSLQPDFLQNFSTDNAGSMENIYTIPYDENNGGGFNLVQMTLHYASQQTYDLQEQPWNGYASLEEFYNSFDENDARIGSFLVGPQFASDGSRLEDVSAESSDPDGPPLTFTPEINELAPNSLRQAGVRVGKFEFANGAGSNLSNDFPIFRYSDVLLMKAEALLRTGDASGALDLVNQIRARAGATPLTGVDEDVMLAERGREFFAEGWRRNDLIRFGKFNDAWWEKSESDPSKNVYPIPQPAIDVNPFLNQNPGY